MIDTIKIYTMINKQVYNRIYHNSILKTSYSQRDGQIFYEIVNDKLEGSYSNSLSVRVGCGVKYKFVGMYYLEIEGSYHKLMLGYNSHNGFYNLQHIVKYLIGAVEYAYNLKLPEMRHWFLQRLDLAICFDLGSNATVSKYIDNIRLCAFPRRGNPKHYPRESLYTTGTTTTLKIYNKLVEFKKHDMKKLYKTNFDIESYLKEIDGFIRFECEIKKKKLKEVYHTDFIRVNCVKYEDLRNVWSDEFMKLLDFFKSDLEVVRKKDEVEQRIYSRYLDNPRKARILYDFYISLMVDGKKVVKNRISSSTFYRNLSLLKELNIDLNQKFEILDEEITVVDFNPFSWKEVV